MLCKKQTYNDILYIKENKLFLKTNKGIFFKEFNKDVINQKTTSLLDNYRKFLKLNRLSTICFYKNLLIIYDSQLSINDINFLKKSFYDFGYKKVILKEDLSLINVNKKDFYLISGNTIKLYYVDSFNVKKVLLLDKKVLEKREIKSLIESRVNNNNIIIIGKDDYQFKNYYIYEDEFKFFLNLLS